RSAPRRGPHRRRIRGRAAVLRYRASFQHRARGAGRRRGHHFEPAHRAPPRHAGTAGAGRAHPAAGGQRPPRVLERPGATGAGEARTWRHRRKAGRGPHFLERGPSHHRRGPLPGGAGRRASWMKRNLAGRAAWSGQVVYTTLTTKATVMATATANLTTIEPSVPKSP